MHCELIVPGLLSSAGASRFPALELLLARGRRSDPESQTLEQWLHEAFGQAGGTLAAGALTAAARGIEPGAGWWARADPVHLQLMRDRLVVAPAEAIDISDTEADALTGALNRHFGDSARFRALEPRRWIVELTEPRTFLDGPALVAAGHDVAAARGDDAMLTEIQMLLHSHPVNEAREARGEPAVNSVWLWGGGRMPAAGSVQWRSLASADPVALGLAHAAGIRRLELPESADAWLSQLPGEGRHLALLDGARVAAALDQHAEHEEAVAALERAWFAPLLAALRAERVGMVTIRVPAPGASFEAIRGDLRRFWRRRRPLVRYMESA